MMDSRPFYLGLTGGIGSGKSTVAEMLAALGATVIDADAVSRSLSASGGAAIPALAAAFGADFITAEGALDRDHMRALVFTDPSAKQRLEGILHPLIGQEIWRRAAVAAQLGTPCIVFDVPLLVESATWRDKVDQVLVVDCLPETQITRVMARSGLPRASIEAIMATQASRSARLQVADAVILNDGLTLAQLKQAVLALAPGFGLSLPPPDNLTS